MNISFKFAWYDFWIGGYYDQKKSILYICPLPMFSFALNFTKYYEIIGHYTGDVIGWTTSPDDVLKEEPEAHFRQISQKEFISHWEDHV